MFSLATPGQAEIEYKLIPYLWTAGLDAEIGPPGRTTSADISFSDHVKSIDAGAAFAFEAKGEQWSFLSDVLWVKLGEDVNLPRTTLDLENEQLVLEFAVGYRPMSWKETQIVAGARFVDMDTTIEFQNGSKVDTGDEWLDPFIGLEWRPRRGKWEFLIEGDIGGGNDADFTWASMLGVSYHFNDRFALSGAYRILDIDFESDDFVFDGQMEGIQVGLMFKF